MSRPILVNGPVPDCRNGMVALVVEGQVHAGRDAAGQVLQSFEQVGFGLDVRRGGDEFLGLGDRVGEGTRDGIEDTPRR